eukprot:scaffold34682_cov243-Amphora_coffeaeformis.AAC.15
MGRFLGSFGRVIGPTITRSTVVLDSSRTARGRGRRFHTRRGRCLGRGVTHGNAPFGSRGLGLDGPGGIGLVLLRQYSTGTTRMVATRPATRRRYLVGHTDGTTMYLSNGSPTDTGTLVSSHFTTRIAVGQADH